MEKVKFLDDTAVQDVSGGATAIEYGLIAALIAVSLIKLPPLPTMSTFTFPKVG